MVVMAAIDSGMKIRVVKTLMGNFNHDDVEIYIFETISGLLLG